MPHTANGYRFTAVLMGFSVFLLSVNLLGCASDSHTARGAAEGAKRGAIAGAVGGLVGALVFGGDPVDRTARGAVYGGATGAAFGAMAGSERDRREKQTQEAEIAKLRAEIGVEAFDGLAALAECRHDVSLQQATKAKRSENPNHALAGLWLEVLSHADRREEEMARGLFPEVIQKDWEVKTEAQAEETMRQALNNLMDIRQQYELPRVCR